MNDGRRPVAVDPLYAGGYLFLWAGAALSIYLGLDWLDLAPRVHWISWSHIHFLTIGAFVQFAVGYLPRTTAAQLDRPAPPRWYAWVNAGVLDGSLVLLWYGWSSGHVAAFDVGTTLVLLLAVVLLVQLFAMVVRSDGRNRDVSVGFSLLAVFVFLWGITYAYGLFGRTWDVPGGWTGLRESHVHANTWGFLALAAVGALYRRFPKLVGGDLYSHRLKTYSFWFFTAGIFPLITGPWLGIRAVIVAGLGLYTIGFLLYYYTLIRTYVAGEPSGPALFLLVAQFWILGPGLAAPLLLFEVGWVDPTFLEQGLVHFFFVGWALPVLLTGIVLHVRRPIPGGIARHERAARADGSGGERSDLQAPISHWTVWVWNGALVVFVAGFLFQDGAVAPVLFAGGATILLVVWVYLLGSALRLRFSAVRTVRRTD